MGEGRSPDRPEIYKRLVSRLNSVCRALIIPKTRRRIEASAQEYPTGH
jgi:hypothetical protein